MPISIKKQEAARRNAALATAANVARIAERPRWRCIGCGKEEPATAHRMRNKYCSNACVSAAYRGRMLGQDNPNFKGAGWQVCEHCDKDFHSYDKKRRYCSLACRDRMAFGMRTAAKKDANHGEVVKALQAAGAAVLDMSRMAFGMPDLIVLWRDVVHLVEIKNPRTSYGRKGLSASQRKWAAEWRGGPVYVVRSADDVARFLAGELKAEIVSSVDEAIKEVTR